MQAQSQSPQRDLPPPPDQNTYCVKTKSLTRTDLQGMFPFSKTNRVQVVSFKPAYESPPLIDGNLDESKFIESKDLNDSEINELVNVLCNYTYDPKLPKDSIIGSFMACYEPRNAIVFRDQRDIIIAFLVVCFECEKYEARNIKFPLSEFCREKWGMFKDVMIKAGIKYGTINTD